MPIWLLQLVWRGRNGRMATALTILAVGLFWFFAAGTFDPANEEVSRSAAIFFVVILAYIVPVFHYITEQSVRAFDQLAPHLRADEATVARWRRSIGEKSLGNQVAVVALGLLCWFAHTMLLMDGSLERLAAAAAKGPGTLSFLVAPLLVWVAMMCAVTALVQNAVLFRRLAAHVKIDLADTSPLMAFGRVAVISTLALVGAQAALAILWFDAEQAVRTSLPGLTVIAIAMVALFVLPITPIRSSVAAAKQAELGRVLASLNGERVALARENADDRMTFARLSPYLAYRREIVAVNDWPFDSNIVSRLAFYLIIPPLTWLGAAMIDVAVERLL